MSQKRIPTWDRRDDLPHLQPICEPPHHRNQNSETLANRTADPRGITEDWGRKRSGSLTEDGSLAGIVEAEDEDAGLAVSEHGGEEPREHDAHGGAPTQRRGAS